MKRLWSVFTDDMEHCYFTGAAPVERHHIFPGNPNRKNSEKYGFVIPLRPELHPNGTQAGKNAAEMDLKLKQMAQPLRKQRRVPADIRAELVIGLKHPPAGERTRSCGDLLYHELSKPW